MDLKPQKPTQSISGCSPSGVDNSYYQNAWRLSYMAMEGDSIFFEYEDENYSHDIKFLESRKERIGTGVDIPPGDPCFSNTSINGKRLSKITSTNGYSIDFIANTERNDLSSTYRLDAVKIHKDGLLIGSWELSYDYFGTNTKLKTYRY